VTFEPKRICYGFRARKAKAARKKPLSAVKLVDDLAGESPVSASFPVGTVVISGDGAGNQTAESPEVNVFVGWGRIRSAQDLGGLATWAGVTGFSARLGALLGRPGVII
jgi:hypothetical protein